jgi:hypothetical protein
MAQLFTIEVKDQATGAVVWSKKDVPGEMLMSLAQGFSQAKEMATVAGDIAKAANSIKMAFGKKK